MSSSEKLRKFCEKLTLLCMESRYLMKIAGTDTSELIAVVAKVETASQTLVRLAVDLLCSDDGEETVRWVNVIKEEPLRKVKFDARSTAWLKVVELCKEIQRVTSQSLNRRSSKLCSSIGTSMTSRARRARLIANEELARLKREQLEQQHEMEHEAEELQRAEREAENLRQQ